MTIVMTITDILILTSDVDDSKIILINLCWALSTREALCMQVRKQTQSLSEGRILVQVGV